jgi:Uma2 family endonuclease
MALNAHLYTAADLEAFYNLPENADKKFELFRGAIYEVPTGTPLHAWIISTLVRIIGMFVKEHDLGFVFSDSIDFYLPNGDVFIPDVSYISKKRQPTLPEKIVIAPDLAIEIVSPTNRPREILNKVQSDLESGSFLVWVAYPDQKVVDVYRLSLDGGLLLHTFDINATLDGEDVLPGLKISVRDVFPQ